MRLICPNCGAQYDVDDGVVPEAGRDVQCSNCGHTWFQRPAAKDAELAEELGAALPEADLQEEAEAEQAVEPEPTIAEDTAQSETPEEEPAAENQPQRTELDPSVADILREESERETAERAAEGSSLESQPDLGLGDGDDAEAAARERMARLRGMGDEDIAAAVASGTRKDLLPDIEEINSTLTASSDREGDETADEYQEKRKRSGFRRGFTVALVVFAIMALVYVYAPKIAELIPGAEQTLNSYVEWVNGLRIWLDQIMQQAVDKLTGLVSQVSGGDTAQS